MLYGEAGFERCFHKHKQARSTSYSYNQNIVREHGEFLHSEDLAPVSSKIAEIIHEIDNSDIIVFVYSAWIKGGILPMMLALEQHGYRKYNCSEKVCRCEHKDEPILVRDTSIQRSRFQTSQLHCDCGFRRRVN